MCKLQKKNYIRQLLRLVYISIIMHCANKGIRTARASAGHPAIVAAAPLHDTVSAPHCPTRARIAHPPRAKCEGEKEG